jgi:hypothetical protein
MLRIRKYNASNKTAVQVAYHVDHLATADTCMFGHLQKLHPATSSKNMTSPSDLD